jgi:hypothetical protein
MSQTLFVAALYLLGVLFALLLRKRIPAGFIVISGYLWGTLLWVVAAIVSIVVARAVTLPLTISGLGIMAAGVAALHIRQDTWRLSRREGLGIAGMLALVSGVALASSHYNYASVSPDSVNQILFGRVLVLDGITDWVSTEFASRGIFLPAIQSASVFLGDDYLWSVQPVFGASFCLVFIYLTQRALCTHKQQPSITWGWAGAAGFTLMVGVFFMLFQVFYIHNNFLSGIYLFVAVASFWLALQEDNHSWLIVGMLAMAAFTLARIEAALFGMIFLSILIAARQFSYRTRLLIVLPYSVFGGLWYVFLLLNIPSGEDVTGSTLSPSRIILVSGIFVAASVGIVLTRYERVRRQVLPYVPYLMGAGLLAGLGMVLVSEPGNLHEAIRNTIDNMLFAIWWPQTWISYWWGMTWFTMLLLALVSLTLPRIPHERLFALGIPAFFVLVFDFLLVRGGYRLGWGDSANRMLVHILPVIVFYFALKYYRARSVTDEHVSAFARRWRPALLAGFGAALLVVLIRYAQALV